MDKITEIVVTARMDSTCMEKLRREGLAITDEYARAHEVVARRGDQQTGVLFHLALDYGPKPKRGGKLWTVRIDELPIRQVVQVPAFPFPDAPTRPHIQEVRGLTKLMPLKLAWKLALEDIEEAWIDAMSNAIVERLKMSQQKHRELEYHKPQVEFDHANEDFLSWVEHALPGLIGREKVTVGWECRRYDPNTDDFEMIDLDDEYPGFTERLLKLDWATWELFNGWHEDACQLTYDRTHGEHSCPGLNDLLAHSWRLWEGENPDYLEPEFVYRRDGKGIAQGYREPPRRDAPIGRLRHVECAALRDGTALLHEYDISDRDMYYLAQYGEHDYCDELDPGDYEDWSGGTECSNCQGDPCWCSQYYE